jgi:hypothetical protein
VRVLERGVVMTGVPVLDTTVPHPARRYCYWLGGKDHFEADRKSGDEIEAAFPFIRNGVLQNRFLHGRLVRYLAAECGVRQFLDLGTGLPAPDNTHEIVQDIAPQSRILYVDNDPLVLSHARALLTAAPGGVTAYLEADLRNPEQIVSSPEFTGTFDLSQPIGVLMMAILHFIPGRQAYTSVRHVMDAVPPGSYLAASHAAYELLTREHRDNLLRRERAGKNDFVSRSRDGFVQFFDGYDLVEPGVVPVQQWRPRLEDTTPLPNDQVGMFGGLAKKRGTG